MEEILSIKEIEKYNAEKRQKYFESINKELRGNKLTMKPRSIIRTVTHAVLPYVRNYDFHMEGVENIPKETNCLFVANHSNSHDAPTAQETLSKLGINQFYLASNEGLNPVITKLFVECGAILFNRLDKKEANEAFIKMTSNLINGGYGVIFAESTWNLHPYKPMHLIKTGAAYSAVIANTPIVPVIFEYIETNKLCKKEKELYQKCIVTFGKPMKMTCQTGLIEQTDFLQNALEQLRRSIWEKYNIKKAEFDEEDIHRYLNHTYLKKYGGVFLYDSIKENKVLLVKGQLSSENDYHLNDEGLFVPGPLTREEGKQYLLT